MWPTEIQSIDFAGRRKQFLRKTKGGVAIFPAAPNALRNNDVHHPYRQDSNFFYLTGFEEPNALCLLSPESKTPFQMFVEPRNKTKELWEGKILGPEGAKHRLGADAAFPSTPGQFFDEALIEALKEAETVYYRVGVQPEMDSRVFRLLATACQKLGRTGRALWPIVDPESILGEMRLVKTAAEQQRLQVAADITAEGHVAAMRTAKPHMFEYELEAILHHAFRVHGAGRAGYSSIVASGPNACVLHYVQNDRRMSGRDLLLIDAGAEFDYYTADITRVCPVGGTFSEPQREIYEAVLTAQKEGIRLARPGKTVQAIHQTTVEVLVEELKRLKVLKGPTKKLIESRTYSTFYPHGTGHWLGMDVHDIGTYYVERYQNHRKLEPGHVLTIEPGLYFSPDSPGPARYKGIGVRIEDDVLITANGCKVLTVKAPKEIEEIESLCSR